MVDQPRAVVVPYSSIVGSSVTLHHREEGYVEAQLAILGVGGNPGEDHKSRQIAVATEVAKAVNLMPRMLYMLEVIRDGESDRVSDGEKRSIPETLLRQISQLLHEARA